MKNSENSEKFKINLYQKAWEWAKLRVARNIESTKIPKIQNSRLRIVNFSILKEFITIENS